MVPLFNRFLWATIEQCEATVVILFPNTVFLFLRTSCRKPIVVAAIIFTWLCSLCSTPKRNYEISQVVPHSDDMTLAEAKDSSISVCERLRVPERPWPSRSEPTPHFAEGTQRTDAV